MLLIHLFVRLLPAGSKLRCFGTNASCADKLFSEENSRAAALFHLPAADAAAKRDHAAPANQLALAAAATAAAETAPQATTAKATNSAVSAPTTATAAAGDRYSCATAAVVQHCRAPFFSAAPGCSCSSSSRQQQHREVSS